MLAKLRSFPCISGILLCCQIGSVCAQDVVASDPGPVYVGHYAPVEMRAHIKLWLARYANPALLATADVAFAYPLTEYCRAKEQPSRLDFYTDAFAVARADGTGYAVSKLEQLHKIDVCKSPTAGMAVLTKRPLGDLASAMVINWEAEQSVGGLALTEPMRAPDAPYQFNSSGIPTAFVRELDTKLLLAYAPDLARRGVEISLNTSAWYPPADTSGPAVMAVMSRLATSERPAAAAPSPAPKDASQLANMAKKRYCLRSPSGTANKTGDCFDGFGELALRLSTLPEDSAPKGEALQRWRAISATPTSAAPPPPAKSSRYILEVN